MGILSEQVEAETASNLSEYTIVYCTAALTSLSDSVSYYFRNSVFVCIESVAINKDLSQQLRKKGRTMSETRHVRSNLTVLKFISF